jgi:hypothetical protein
MSSQSEHIQFNVRLPNDTFHEFHKLVMLRAQTKQEVIRRLVSMYVEGKITLADLEKNGMASDRKR